MTRAEAAALSDAAPEAEVLDRWECGEEAPDVMSLNAYLEVLGFDFHDLQNALEGLDAGPEAAPVDWLDEFMESMPGSIEDKTALGATLERIDAMYEDRMPAQIRRLRERLLQLERNFGQ